MSDDVAVVVEEKKDEKRGKWTYERAIAWMRKNGHTVGEKQVHLSPGAGIAAFGCGDYLRRIHKFEIFNPSQK